MEANVNLALIKHAFGHRSIASTAIYTQPTDERAESAHTLHILITDLSRGASGLISFSNPSTPSKIAAAPSFDPIAVASR